jgi:hypothetical protein
MYFDINKKDELLSPGQEAKQSGEEKNYKKSSKKKLRFMTTVRRRRYFQTRSRK